jgi:hypothetical protein
MPTKTKRTPTRSRRTPPATPRTLKAVRLSELKEDFAHFAGLRLDAEQRLEAARFKGEREFLADVIRLLDLATDAAECVEGFRLTDYAEGAVSKLAGFLR